MSQLLEQSMKSWKHPDDEKTYILSQDIVVCKPEIKFMIGEKEMMKISSDQFYIRGEQLPVDEKEAKSVYEALKAFLVWHTLNK